MTAPVPWAEVPREGQELVLHALTETATALRGIGVRYPAEFDAALALARASAFESAIAVLRAAEREAAGEEVAAREATTAAFDAALYVCPGCYAVGGERCAPGCIARAIEEAVAEAIEAIARDCDEQAFNIERIAAGDNDPGSDARSTWHDAARLVREHTKAKR